MSALDDGLRDLIREIVRTEIRAALAAAAVPDEMLCTAAAAEIADVCTKTVRRWVRDGRLVGHRAGRELRVSRRELNEVMRGERLTDRDLTPEEMAQRDFG